MSSRGTRRRLGRRALAAGPAPSGRTSPFATCTRQSPDNTETSAGQGRRHRLARHRRFFRVTAGIVLVPCWHGDPLLPSGSVIKVAAAFASELRNPEARLVADHPFALTLPSFLLQPPPSSSARSCLDGAHGDDTAQDIETYLELSSRGPNEEAWPVRSISHLLPHPVMLRAGHVLRSAKLNFKKVTLTLQQIMQGDLLDGRPGCSRRRRQGPCCDHLRLGHADPPSAGLALLYAHGEMYGSVTVTQGCPYVSNAITHPRYFFSRAGFPKVAQICPKSGFVGNLCA
jgi:hypothetical protein